MDSFTPTRPPVDLVPHDPDRFTAEFITDVAEIRVESQQLDITGIEVLRDELVRRYNHFGRLSKRVEQALGELRSSNWWRDLPDGDRRHLEDALTALEDAYSITQKAHAHEQ